MKPIKIPQRLKNFNFVLLGGDDGKKPIEKGWTNKEHRQSDRDLLKHLDSGKNYGVRGGKTSPISINGKSYFLLIVDFDKRDFQDKIKPLLPETFMTTSGSAKNCDHFWFASDNDKSFKILDENRETLCDVLAEGKQVVAPPSKHKSGSSYKIISDVDFAFISYTELEAILKPHDKSPKKPPKQETFPKLKSINSDVAEKMIDSISMEDVLKEMGVDTSNNPTNCPLHSSKRNKCLSWTNELVHCFHCQKDNEGWNKFSFVREVKNLTNKETFNWFAEKTGMQEELKKSRKKFAKEKQKELDFSLESMIDAFLDKNPIFYDKARILWKWNFEKCRWEQIDITDLGIVISSAKKDGVEISKKFLDIILERARLRIPKNPEPTWVQFKDKIYDFVSGKSFEASPEYFMTNPISFEMGGTIETPNIDRLFGEWVGNKFVETLYEIVAYSLSPNKFMQRIFALVGGGSNGKSTFMSLLQKLLGQDNYTSSELKLLAERNFETSILYKKLLCIIGEVAYDDLSNTSQLKKLSGEDEIRFEFKGKQPFSDKNTASVICLTNSLPRTPDRSVGFYRRWLIVDFPNQFEVGENPVTKIPEKEFSNLAKRCFEILKRLFQERKFSEEGTYQERETIYEEKSNPVMLFLEEVCEDTPGQHTPKRLFFNEFNVWLKKRHQRPLSINQVGRMLRANGYDVGSRKIDGESVQVVVNCSFKPVDYHSYHRYSDFSKSKPIGESSIENGSNDGKLGNFDQKTNKSSPKVVWEGRL